MKTPDYEKAKEIVLTMLSNLNALESQEQLVETVDQVLATGLVSSEQIDRDALIRNLESLYAIFSEEHTILEEGYAPWLMDNKATIQWKFWERFRRFLLKDKEFAPDTVNRLDNLTDDILDRLGNPLDGGPWDKRGLVVGQVQSGKTSNYSGLINKAIDAGYRLIIVLAGVHNNLRAQTQLRMDESIVGFDTKTSRMFDLDQVSHWFGVGNHDRDMPVHSLTTSDIRGDFRKSSAESLGINIRANDPIILVVKKNTTILRNLIEWLHVRASAKQDGVRSISDVPLLLIDDEADHASINIGRASISSTNKYIRVLLSLFDRSSYVGYTATPFANIFTQYITPEHGSDIREQIGSSTFLVGQELFPKDFIVNIKPPSNYIGPAKVFGLETQYADFAIEEPDFSSAVVKVVKDYSRLIPDKHKMADPVPDRLPDSLKRAIKSFLLTCAIRRVRGQESEHNSMLVHVSVYVRWQDKIAQLVDHYLKSLKHQLEFGMGSAEPEIHEIWRSEYIAATREMQSLLIYDDPDIRQHTWEEIAPELHPAASKIQVRAVHGMKNPALLNFPNVTPLDYYDYKRTGLSVIAVGGNKLSRGLTLEGLSVSYYLRASKMYDTLMQMGRWFGYRPGYLDLCRLFTSPELVEWYRHITVASEEVRAEFDNMRVLNQTPLDYGLKVRTHPGVLQITAANKLRSHEKLLLSYSERLVETYEFQKSEKRRHNNLKALSKFVGSLGHPIKIKSQEFGWTGVAPDAVSQFLRSYKTDQRNIASDKIADYIDRQSRNRSSPSLTDWTVVLVSNSSAANRYMLELPDRSLNVGLTVRSDAGTSAHYTLKKAHIISPTHEFLDIDESSTEYLAAMTQTSQDRYKRLESAGRPDTFEEPKYPAGIYVRRRRSSKRGLLTIYLLDPVGCDGCQRSAPIVGYAISFPRIENDSKVEYAVNEQFLAQQFDYDESLDDDEEDNDD